MDFDERALYLALGCVIGFILGYVVRTLKDIEENVIVVNHYIHDIKEEVDEIDIFMKQQAKDDRGAMRLPSLRSALLFLVVTMVVWASFSTGATNSKLEETVIDLETVQARGVEQDRRLEKITQCNLEFTSKTILALNERTTYSQAQANANVRVLKGQKKFLEVILIIPPVSKEDNREALKEYVSKLDTFSVLVQKSRDKTKEYAYPTNMELSDCLGVALLEVENGEKEIK